MPTLRNARKFEIYRDSTRYTCQVGATQLANGDVVVVFNERRGLAHLDFDSIALIRSTDSGYTWDPALSKRTVWECTHSFGSDTPSVMQVLAVRLAAV